MTKPFEFVDMAGTVAGVAILRRLPNVSGNACWAVQCACGARLTALGTRLRQLDRDGKRLRCRVCIRAERRAIALGLDADPLPAGPGWPRGWWLSTRGGLACCGCPRKRLVGVPILLTGEPGEVYCRSCARARDVARKERAG